MWPQIVFCSLYVVSLLTAATKGGREFWTSLAAIGICTFVLYEGGFWAPLGFAP